MNQGPAQSVTLVQRGLNDSRPGGVLRELAKALLLLSLEQGTLCLQIDSRSQVKPAYHHVNVDDVVNGEVLGAAHEDALGGAGAAAQAVEQPAQGHHCAIAPRLDFTQMIRRTPLAIHVESEFPPLHPR